MTNLQEELGTKAKNLKWKGKRNYIFAYVLYGLAAVASGIATIWTAALVARRTAPDIWVAVLASIPGVSVILNETLKPEPKGRWCYEKRVALEALLRKSKYAGVSDAETVSRWNDLEIKMESEWPRFGTAHVKPTRSTSRK